MDELSEKIAGILNDPESMQKVRAMAENILGEKKENNNEKTDQNLENILGVGEMQGLISIISKLKSSGNDPRSQLLKALKPHLSSARQEKVDTAIKILKMLELLPLMKESGILKL